jgi:hypothetical protein
MKCTYISIASLSSLYVIGPSSHSSPGPERDEVESGAVTNVGPQAHSESSVNKILYHLLMTISPGVKRPGSEADHSPRSPIPPLPPYVFVV